MPIKIGGRKYYYTAEACQVAGISKNTFLRWVKDGTFAEVEHRDRRGWRLFKKADLNRLKAEVNQVDRIR